MLGNDIPEVYIFQGRDGEEVPLDVQELAFKPDVRVLPAYLCYERKRLRKVTLPKGLRVIGNGAFYGCRYLSEINTWPFLICHVTGSINKITVNTLIVAIVCDICFCLRLGTEHMTYITKITRIYHVYHAHTLYNTYITRI